MNPYVFCLGLNPAVQRTLVFDHVETGEVNRAVAQHVSAAGKSINTAAALERLGTHACVAAFNGGSGGRAVARLMREQGVGNGLTPIAGETRTCTTILDRRTGTVTELVEEGPAVTARERRAFVGAGVRRAAACRLLAISGTLPPGTPDAFYVPFVTAAARAGTPVVIDSHRAALLAVLPLRPLLAKLNVRELAHTFACRCATEKQILQSARRLLALGAQWALVTQGGRPAVLLGPAGGVWRLTPPVIQPLNPIGSGDCVTAGLIHAWLQGRCMPDAARAGIACGSANALTQIPADFVAADARRLYRLTRVQALAAAAGAGARGPRGA
jgi:1-phosphofructokinase family hexose kinase